MARRNDAYKALLHHACLAARIHNETLVHASVALRPTGIRERTHETPAKCLSRRSPVNWSTMVDAVLFVDDDEDLRAVVRDTLLRLGVQRVVLADSLRQVQESGDDALRCDLAILDINLGNGQPSGLEVHEWLRCRHFVGRIAFLTGHAGNDPRVRSAASLAGSHVATKPLMVAGLRELIGLPRDAR